MPSTSRGYPYPSGSDDVDIPGENALFTYLTSDAWPTTLPGTASGSIPA